MKIIRRNIKKKMVLHLLTGEQARVKFPGNEMDLVKDKEEIVAAINTAQNK